MFVKAISNDNINRDYLFVKRNDEVIGYCRLYTQKFITVEEIVDVLHGNDEEENYGRIVTRKTKIKVADNSIKRLRCCYCNKYAQYEYRGNFYCEDCQC
jgi:hypothetical protein